MDLIDREKALGCFWSYGDMEGNGYDETDMPAYDRLQALPIVAEVEDCISRKAARDKLLQLVQDRYAWQKDALEYVRGVNAAINAIKNLPSAEPSAQPEITNEEIRFSLKQLRVYLAIKIRDGKEGDVPVELLKCVEEIQKYFENVSSAWEGGQDDKY